MSLARLSAVARDALGADAGTPQAATDRVDYKRRKLISKLKVASGENLRLFSLRSARLRAGELSVGLRYHWNRPDSKSCLSLWFILCSLANLYSGRDDWRPLCFRALLRWTRLPDQVERAVDQADVTVGLGKIAQHAAG